MTNRIGTCLVFSVLLISCQPKDQTDSPVINYWTSELTKPLNLPFSEAVQIGNMLSGQLGALPGTTNLVPGGIAAETKQTMENIRRTLEENGSSLDKVVKCTIMLEDISEWQAMNEVYVTFFPNHKPARSAFGTNGLALGARVEIECLATVD